jgi:predicted flap endonuclease-1-like 5' DNA nuclease
MIHKSLFWIGLAVTWLGTNAFTAQDQPSASGSSRRAAFGLLLICIFIVAILLILQKQKTPESLTRYHLNHAAHAQEHGEHAAPVETTAGEVLSAASSVAEVEQARIAAVPLPPIEPDDLTRIEGIGPKISEILGSAGITRFDQLAATDVDKLHDLLKNAGPRFALADPSSWPEQAGYLAAGDMEKLKALSDRLRGGRKIG